MATLGIGVDIVENSRIRKSINNKKFLLRIFTKNEIAQSIKTNSKVAFFSKRFAAKEAFSKALGLGFRKNLNFKDISIINNKYGKPSIKIKDKLQNIIKKQFKTNKVNILLSISDENKYSIAFVILEKNEIK
jgi:holo-[acyl-carrier protein] synthase